MDEYEEKVIRAREILRGLDLLRNRVFSAFCEDSPFPSVTPRQISLISNVGFAHNPAFAYIRHWERFVKGEKMRRRIS